MNNNLDNSFQTRLNHSSGQIAIVIQGLGPVPSYKNHKRIFRNQKTGRPIFATKPEVKQWMERAIASFVSQLYGLFPMIEGETLGECQKRLQTSSLVPLDDSLAWMIPGEQRVQKVKKGEEGCIILIEKLK